MRRMTQYLLCIGNAHDEQLGWERERQWELLVICALLQCLERVTQGAFPDAQRPISHQHHLQAKRGST